MMPNEVPLKNPADVGSVDAIIAAAYDVISGRAGEPRDWDRLRSLFATGARMIPTSKEAGVSTPDEKIPECLDLEGYIVRVAPHFEKNGFFETEISRRTEQFGQIVHAFSTYESRHDPNDPDPFMRG